MLRQVVGRALLGLKSCRNSRCRTALFIRTSSMPDASNHRPTYGRVNPIENRKFTETNRLFNSLSLRTNAPNPTSADVATDVPTESSGPPLKCLIEAFRESSNLEKQKKRFGKCLKKPLPLRENLSFENFFMEDITNSSIYEPFVDFVRDIKRSALESNKQNIYMGLVVQLPGYGKTHLARVFTRVSKALYFKLGYTVDSPFTYMIQRQIDDLKAQIMPNGLHTATSSQYKEFTDKSTQVVEVFFLSAIKHYAACYQRLLDMNFNEKAATAISSQVFDNGCGKYFQDTVLKDAWAQMHDNNWVTSLYAEALNCVNKYNIQTLFCDEVHSLQGLFVGEFSHTAPPVDATDWSESLIPARAAYERHVFKTKSTPPDVDPVVAQAYDRPTSLTYLVVTSLENIMVKANIGSIFLTTEELALTFNEGSEASRDRLQISKFEKFSRDAAHEAIRQNQVIKEYFGIDIHEYIKRTNMNHEEIIETFGSRAVYFKRLLQAVIDFLVTAKPTTNEINKVSSLDVIWDGASGYCISQAKQIVQMLKANKQYYNDVLYGALFHNGHLQNLYPPSQFAVNNRYVPIVAEKVHDVWKLRMADWWVLKHLTSESIETYGEAIKHAHDLATNSGLHGEDLLKLVLIFSFGKPVAELAVKGSTFHAESIVNQYFLDAKACGDVVEFGMTPLGLLQDPLNTLKQRYIKVPDLVKPDGLTLLANVQREYIISAWQSKNWNQVLGPQQVQTALESLDPNNFFAADSGEWTDWQQMKNPNDWTKYIRVIWAKDFSATAIAYVNLHNMNVDNINTPVVLVSFNKLPQDLNIAPVERKQQKPRKTKRDYNFGLSDDAKAHPKRTKKGKGKSTPK